ncbi:hypothetical protein D9M71_811330 [compost metagenome]
MNIGSLPALAAIHHFTLAGQCGGDVRQRRQIAAGAHRTFLRNQRQNVVFKERLQAFQQFHAHPGHTLAKRLQTGRQHRAGGLRVQ